MFNIIHHDYVKNKKKIQRNINRLFYKENTNA